MAKKKAAKKTSKKAAASGKSKRKKADKPHRNIDNLGKYARRGPGRPKGSRNKPKTPGDLIAKEMENLVAMVDKDHIARVVKARDCLDVAEIARTDPVFLTNLHREMVELARTKPLVWAEKWEPWLAELRRKIGGGTLTEGVQILANEDLEVVVRRNAERILKGE